LHELPRGSRFFLFQGERKDTKESPNGKKGVKGAEKVASVFVREKHDSIILISIF
jgi:hypothetical protein